MQLHCVCCTPISCGTLPEKSVSTRCPRVTFEAPTYVMSPRRPAPARLPQFPGHCSPHHPYFLHNVSVQGVLAVYDVTNRKSFEHVEEWMRALREVAWGFLRLTDGLYVLVNV